MLTRIEISGFKSFEDFSMDIGPFMVIFGPNASGKSNIFDAIQLVSKVTSANSRGNLLAAVSDLRGAPDDVFTKYPNGESSTVMSFALEVLLDAQIQDSLGETINLNYTRLRYELDIQQLTRESGEYIWVVRREEVRPILEVEDYWVKELYLPSKEFKQHHLHYGRSEPLLTTIPAYVEESPTVFEFAADGRRNQVLRRELKNPTATMLSSVSSDLPHLYALQQEISTYALLHLNPSALRQPSTALVNDMSSDGANLAALLARIKEQTATADNPLGYLSFLASDLSDIVPGIRSADTVFDPKQSAYVAKITNSNGMTFGCGAVSDGTLRTLAMLALLYDPERHSLICFEEPENGIHPLHLKALMVALRRLSIDVEDEEVRDEKLTQILFSSHSPVLLNNLNLDKGEAVFIEVATAMRPSMATPVRKTVAKPLLSRLPAGPGIRRQVVSKYQVNRYLSSVNHEAVVHG